MSEDAVLARWRDRILAAAGGADAVPLRLRGGGTKDFYGENSTGEEFDTREYAGIVDYEPTELVVTARCGTPLAEVESVLAEHGQFLAFEPPAFGGDPTIGGVIAAGLSGPRRAAAGAARDFVLGTKLLNAKGELLRFGGQVMKNVAGFDVSRLLCGSLGILGVIVEVSLKVLPQPRAETTLQFATTALDALDRFNRWRAQPLPISATAWHDGSARVRLSGAASAVRAARETIGGTALHESDARDWWSSLRDQTLPWFADASTPLWRLSLPATAPLDQSGGEVIEWSGAVRWLRGDAPAARIRDRAERLGGTAIAWRGRRDAPMFHPLAPVVLELHRRLKHEFDPRGIFNRGRLVADL